MCLLELPGAPLHWSLRSSAVAVPTLKQGAQCLEHMLCDDGIQEGTVVSGNGAALRHSGQTLLTQIAGFLLGGWGGGGRIGTEHCRTGCVTERLI